MVNCRRWYASARQSQSKYHHELSAVDEGKRYQISALHAQGCSVAEIATAIQVHRSTVYREMKRNSQGGAYRPEIAHAKALARRFETRKYRAPEQTVMYVELALSWDWSPEQISGVSKLVGMPVSHEWIYRTVMSPRTRRVVASSTRRCARVINGIAGASTASAR